MAGSGTRLAVVWFHGRARLWQPGQRRASPGATNFLDWPGGGGLTLGTCTQTDLERWMADPTVSYRDETGRFVRWSVQQRHSRDLTYATVRWTGPLSTIDSENGSARRDPRADARHEMGVGR
ncbi:hypothetical protein AB0L49_49170 [Streptomyces antimycoticus]|uniref:hypothetical protein n=1 Tax=Streptomyces antimycoticus TaxID=68175 RepID=UPI0034361383